MAAYNFGPFERLAVFTAHGTRQGTKCWLCGEPLSFIEMEVDHVLPEKLLNDGAELARVLNEFGLPRDFNLNSFENWLPAHAHCNLQKLKHVFRPTPLIQRWLDRARERADHARELRDTSLSRRKIESAIGILATGNTALPQELLEEVIQFYATANSQPTVVGDRTNYVPPDEMRVGPKLIVIFDDVPRPDANGPFTYVIETSPKKDRDPK